MNIREKLISLYSSGADARRVTISLKNETKKQINDHIANLNLPISKNAPLIEKIYWIINDLLDYPPECRCKICNKNILTGKFKSFHYGYTNNKLYCSINCRVLDKDYWEQIKLTNLTKYGHINNMHGKDIRKKTKEKWTKKYGVDNPLKNKTVLEKVKNTNRLRRGVDMPAQDLTVWKKREETCLRLYGYKNPFLGPKSKETSMKKYGVEFPMQHPDIFNRVNKFKRKTAKFLNSNIQYRYQGFENVAIDLLINSGIKIEEIIIGDAKKIPVIEYFNPIKNKLCFYYPDIFIPHKNKIIEVKSEYTLKLNIIELKAKHMACINLGITHETWICTDKKLKYIFNDY